MTPLLTVGLPVYNSETYLAECIESIKAQTLREFVVLAVLDCPTDNSAEVLRKHADSRFQIIENPTNIGLAATCNLMLSMCETDLLARMDADDVMHPERLKRQYEFMQAHPEIDILGTYVEEIDKDGRILRKPFPLCQSSEQLREEFRIRCALYHPTIVLRVPRILALGGYPDSRVAEDLILYLRGLANGYLYANIPEPLLRYRVHDLSQMNRERESSYRVNDEAYAKYGPLIWGVRAPNFVAGQTRVERLKRRVKRYLSRLFS